MKIKGNKELFYEIYRFAARVTSMGAIVQNDIEMTPEEYKEWAIRGLKNIDDIKDWILRTGKYIQGCQNKE
jgi:hypothetical protein